VGNDIIIYGEPWIASSDPGVKNNPDWSWYKKDAPICFFNDDARNAYKGPVSNPENKATDRGFAGGNAAERTNVMKALASKTTDEATPVSSIKYLDIHDNWALADQFATKDWDGRFGVDENAFKLAAVLLFTSTGPIVLHGGTEMMRSKGLGPLKEIVKETKTGKVYLHGKRDTYNLRFANQFVWENVGKTRADKDSYCDYGPMIAFWKSLMAFRNSSVGKIFRRAEPCAEGFYHWYVTADAHLLGYRVDDKVLVLMNVGEKPGHFDWVSLPQGKWKLVGNMTGVDVNKPKRGKYALLKGGEAGHKVDLPAQSFMMWVRD
jgi:pullulanase/glycogen debranching enzyme